MTPPFALRATPQARRQIEALRGTPKRELEALKPALARQECAVAGYRLLAGDVPGYSAYCCKHRSGDWRLLTTFEPNAVVIVALGRHADRGCYASLAHLAISPTGQRRERKPACCGPGGWPALGSSRAQAASG